LAVAICGMEVDLDKALVLLDDCRIGREKPHSRNLPVPPIRRSWRSDGLFD
jgi:hypothetical protein